MRVLVTADDKILHDDSDPTNIQTGIIAFELACFEKNATGINRYSHIQIRMFEPQFGLELPVSEVVEIMKQYGA